MKHSFQFFFVAGLMALGIVSCKKKDSPSAADDIAYSSVNKEYVLIRDVDKLRTSDDEVSKRVDSILSGLIDEEFVSTGTKSFDLNNDGSPDLNFEIIDLHKFNENDLPESFDSLAARVIPLSVQVLDNSTYRYADALSMDERISESGNWSNETNVLGTFMNAGKFQGKGEKYLGFRFPNADAHSYGWIKLYCSQHSDTLRIIEYAYNKKAGKSIKAGQR